jgi:hypothetical protein
MVTENVVLAVEAESAPELMPLPVTVTVYMPALDRGGVGGPDPQPSTGSSNPNKATPSVASHFRRPARQQTEPAQQCPGYAHARRQQPGGVRRDHPAFQYGWSVMQLPTQPSQGVGKDRQPFSLVP